MYIQGLLNAPEIKKKLFPNNKNAKKDMIYG